MQSTPIEPLDTKTGASTGYYGPVVLYDGVCALCNRLVRFVLRFDRRRALRFAPLEGAVGTAARASFADVREVDSIVLIREGRPYVRSAAVLEILRVMGGGWRFAVLGYVMPRPVRDALYDWIARYRYRVFGKLDACPVPAAEDRWRFLD